MQNKCIEKNSQSANCKTPSTKRNRENADHWNLAPPFWRFPQIIPKVLYIYIIIYLYICAHGFGDLSISFRYTFWETPRALGQATVYNPCGSSNPRTQSRRGFKMRGSPGHAMPCLKHGSPGSRQEWSLTPRPAISVLGITTGITTSIDYNGCRNNVPAGKKHGKIILRNWVQDSASHL